MSHPLSLRTSLAALALGAGLLIVVPARADGPAAGDESSCVENDCGTRCQVALDGARRATARYLRENVALADGFLPDPICIAVPGVGAMGFHYVHPDRVADLEVDPRLPEVLLYAERESGRRYLIGVEYFVPVLSGGRPWFGSAPPPSVDNPAPVLFGRTFDGPMPGHNPSMPWHYDLHVWAWQTNPAGTFTPFNPNVSCR